MKSQNIAVFRFYEDLNDFLPKELKKKSFDYPFSGNPSVKDAVEAIGVPHTEIDLILVNGESVSFTYHLKDNDFVSVYPVFESLDISDIAKLREKPPREIKFILDVHLGKLCKYLRLFGFDTAYRNDYGDPEIIDTAVREKRIILTRDRELLKNKKVTHGYWLRSIYLKEQLIEVFTRFDLREKTAPFSLCMECNGEIESVTKDNIEEQLKPKTREYYHAFKRCESCGKIYWEGPHYQRMMKFIEEFYSLPSTASIFKIS